MRRRPVFVRRVRDAVCVFYADRRKRGRHMAAQFAGRTEGWVRSWVGRQDNLELTEETTMTNKTKCPECGGIGAEPGSTKNHKDGCPEAFAHDVDEAGADDLAEDYPGQHIDGPETVTPAEVVRFRDPEPPFAGDICDLAMLDPSRQDLERLSDAALRRLLLEDAMSALEDEKKDDLRHLIAGLYEEGVRGFTEMTRAELLDEVEKLVAEYRE
jgi:hypothetical protein